MSCRAFFSWRPARLLAAAGTLGGLITIAMRIFYSWSDGKIWLVTLCNDFVQVWASGRLVLLASGSAPYSGPLLKIFCKKVLGDGDIIYMWVYPPPMLFLAVPFSLLPLWLAYPAFQTAAAIAMKTALRQICGLPPLAVLLCLTSPAAMETLSFGQNGLLTAALLLPALLLPGTFPVTAGVCAGLLIWKPQMALLVPLCYASSGSVRSFLSATATALSVVIVTVLVFGTLPWRLWLASLPYLSGQETAGDAFTLEMAAPLGSLSHSGYPVWIPIAVQIICTVTAAAMVIVVWRQKSVSPGIKAATALFLSVLATPYGYIYDMVAMASGIVILFLEAPSGIGRADQMLLAAAWAAPGIVGAMGPGGHLNMLLPLTSAGAAYTAVKAAFRLDPSDPKMAGTADSALCSRTA
jgi:hypothetical protein